MEFNLEGTEHKVKSNSLVSIGGKLPYYQELPTSKLLDVLAIFVSVEQRDKNLRKKINNYLYPKTRPGYYLEINDHCHLAYADQRDGHGTQHWWRLFFDEQYKEIVERAIRETALTVAGQNRNNSNGKSASSGQANAGMEWGGMYFRSEAEIRIAEALDNQGVLFFANARGRVGQQGSPISAASHGFTGRVELDFLVFYKNKCRILEVDGQHHQEGSQVARDYVRDRLLLREGIPTVRFTGRECLKSPVDVVTEFLNMF